jgi:hypothetical protein
VKKLRIDEFKDRLISQQQDSSILSYDTAILQEVKDEDRNAAEDLLVEWAINGDPLAVEALTGLKKEKAIPVLEILRGKGDAWYRSCVIRTLAKIRSSPSDLDEFKKSYNLSDGTLRTLDAYSIKESENKEAIPLLLDMLSDPSPSVRVHAQEGLIKMLNLESYNEPRQSPLRSMQLAGMTRLSTLWPKAAAKLRNVFYAVMEGAEPKDLDLAYIPSEDTTLPDKTWELLYDFKNEIPVELITKLGQHDKKWLEIVMLSRLISHDSRSPDILYTLGTNNLKTHLKEAIKLSTITDELFVENCNRVLNKVK